MRRTYVRGVGYVVLAVWVAGIAAAACAGQQTPDGSGDDEIEEMVGRPPSKADDPYHLMEIPEEAESAGASGYIGPEETDAEPKAAEATEAEPSEESKVQRPDEGTQCFSCVRICPLDSSGEEANCGGKERDVVCGWGVHETEKPARKLAAAECNGALDMARQMNQWSRIEGKCPPPTCRSAGRK